MNQPGIGAQLKLPLFADEAIKYLLRAGMLIIQCFGVIINQSFFLNACLDIGLDVPGIFRTPGNPERTVALKDSWDKGKQKY